jgi:hypothetical protein
MNLYFLASIEFLLKGGLDLNFFNSIFKRKKLELETIKDIQEDKESDSLSIDPFSYCIFNPYFKCNEDFSKLFSEFEMRLGSLQRYFELNNLHIKEYLSSSKEILRDHKNERSKESNILDQYGKCHYADVDYFYEMHYLSVLLILFTMFENLLSNIVKDISYISKHDFNDFNQKDLPYINKYILFLKNKCKLNIPISQKEWQSLNTIRKVRNNYLHNLNIDIPDELQTELLKIMTPKNNNKVTVNEEFLEMCFNLFGKIASQLEASYWDYKRNLFNIK